MRQTKTNLVTSRLVADDGVERAVCGVECLDYVMDVNWDGYLRTGAGVGTLQSI